MAFEFMQAALDERLQAKLLRHRVEIDSNHQAVIEVSGAHYISFSSNDYLGLSQHPDVLQSYAEGLSLYGASSSASSVVTGYSKEHRLLEELICEHTNKESALLFSSGFAANQALCTALFGVNNQAATLLADKYMHASFVESAVSASATNQTLNFSRFKHNSVDHLQLYLKKSPKERASNTLVATEGIFSMDGDRGCVDEIQSVLAGDKTTKPWLYVDDAHAFGVIGENGMGTCDLASSRAKADAVDILMGTFGKAIGTQGAFIAGSDSLITYLVNFSKHFVYSTAIPAAQARATRSSIEIMQRGKEREQLSSNIALFKKLGEAAGLPLLDVDGPIQPLIVGEPEAALALSASLKKLGVWVNAIRYPTVPKHSDRLRITLSALHQDRDISALVDALSMCLEQRGTA
jgi:8-amino-7-oxononanoate synthase